VCVVEKEREGGVKPSVCVSVRAGVCVWSNHKLESRLSVAATTNGILMNVIFLSAQIFFLSPQTLKNGTKVIRMPLVKLYHDGPPVPLSLS